MHIRVLSGLFFIFVAMQLQAETYRVTFTDTWDEDDVTSGFPSDAHFTTMVGGSHVTGFPFWEPGYLATLGVEIVAETGGVSTFKSEVNAAIQASAAGVYIQLNSFNASGSTFTYFSIFQEAPEVTLISMVAPSPDWFVGVSGLSLYEQGEWLETVIVDLVPWDAGTEDGNGFSIINPATNPQQVIAAPVGSPFVGLPVIGQLTFERISAYDVNQDGNVDAADLIQLRNRLLE